MELEKEHSRLIDDYEQLLEDLPQYKYSKAGTPPELVIEEVERNIFHKSITQDDAKDAIEFYEKHDDSIARFDGLVSDLKEYFEID